MRPLKMGSFLLSEEGGVRSEELWYRLSAMIIFLRANLPCRKIATLFADLHIFRDRVGGADFCSDITFII